MEENNPAKKRVLPALRILVLLVILASAFIGYTRYFMSQHTNGAQASDPAVLDARISALDDSIARHEQRIRELEETTQKLMNVPAPAALVSPPVSSPQPGIPAAAPQDNERIAALEKEIAALKAASPMLDNNAISQSIRLLSAFHRLSDKILMGKAFATELASFEELAGADQSSGSPITALSLYADSGIPTFATLLVTFDQSVGNLNEAEAIPPVSADFWQRFKYNLTHLVTVRRIDEMQTGNGVDTIVSRAQAKLEREDIEAAVAEIKQLPDAARNNFTTWLDDAQMVTEAPSLIAQLEEQVMRKAFHADTPAATSSTTPAPALPQTSPAPPAQSSQPTPAAPSDDEAAPQAPRT